MILKTFIFGALGAIVAVIIQLFIRELPIPAIEFSLLGLLVFAFIEESIKFAATYLAVAKSKFFDEPLDGMVYMITAAMGFATLENFLFLIGIEKVIEITVLRFIGATLLHALTSGFVGFYWMKGLVWKGLISATLIHVGFNVAVLKLPGYEVYATLFLIIAGFFLFYDFDLIKKLSKK